MKDPTWLQRHSRCGVCVNGESCSNFKGGRGLRQGDPMSPYLFTLVMEILTLIIRRRVDMNRDFQYHYGCKRLKITNVCFANDLLMFCHAVKCSIKNDRTKGRPKVAWKNVYRSKQKGGLGLKDLGVWNRAMIVKHLWNIITDKESLWVKWVNTKKLKDGNNTSLWFDNWSCIGPLNKFINYRAMYDERLSAHLTVKDWMEQYNGNWPDEWTNRFPNLVNIQTVRLDMQTKDGVKWRKRDDSLFVDKVGMACNNYKLNEIAAGLSKKTNGNYIDSIIRRICFAASVYLVWQERNNRIFMDEKRNVDDLFGIFNDTAITMASVPYLGVLLGGCTIRWVISIVKGKWSGIMYAGNVAWLEEPLLFCEWVLYPTQ
nr:RNA-directed DNA polymerase, eukaryota, reverse transcriptase zinc-binding domain protein [Tanacetum cinerariifolium]